MSDTDMTKTRGTLVAFGGWAHRDFLDRLVADSVPPFGALVICEPDPDAEPELRALFADGPPVTVIPAALSTEAGKAVLRRYNFPGLESTAKPDSALTQVFPGLRIILNKLVRTITGEDLREALDGAPRPLTVVVDAPGTELEILEALEAADLIAEISMIRLRCASMQFFSYGASRASITTWLKPRHLVLYGCDDSDPDWPELRFQVDATARALENANRTLAEKQAQLDGLGRELEKASERVSEKEAALAEAQAALTRQDARRSEELAALETRLTEAARSELAEAQAALTRQDARRSEELAALETRLTEAARSELAETRTRAETLQRDLALALRMQALARTDLDALREKYLESEAIRTRQEELLRQLTPRLQSAAQQLRLMAPEEPEEDVAAPAFSRTRSKGRR